MSPVENPPLLAFGAHPDDIEFGCGGVIALETLGGRTAHLVVCSRGEAGSNGTPSERVAEAELAASVLGASLDWLDLGGDAHFERRVEHVISVAGIIRRVRPGIVLAPSTVENQHPDHAVVGHMVRDAARLARYGGLKELKGAEPHAIGNLLYFAVSPDAEPRDLSPVLVDVSDPKVVDAWTRAMQAHASQMRTRDYVGLQLARAGYHGIRCGVSHAIPLYPNDPPLVGSLSALEQSGRRF